MGSKKSEKRPEKHKKKKKHRSRSSSRDSSSTGSTSAEERKIKKKLKRKLKKLKRLKKKEKAEKKIKKEKKVEEDQLKSKKKEKREAEPEPGPAPAPSYDINEALVEKAKALAPMTKEEWEKQQNVLKRVYDEETGRTRLVKGNGEIMEECVSRERHLAINKQATRGDGEYFQKVLGMQKN